MAEAKGDILSMDQIETLHARWRRSEEILHAALDVAALGETERARGELRALLATDPEYPVAHFQLARLLAEHGEHETALEHAFLAYQLGHRGAAVVTLVEDTIRALAAVGHPNILRFTERFTELTAHREPTLTLAMIVKNEEEHLANCLRSVRGVVNEAIVVDTGSTDDTVAIAIEAGARVFFFEWCDDFSAARNVSLRHASGDWILWLDADEELSPESIEPLKTLIRDQTVAAAHLRIDNLMSGRIVPFLTPRLWRNHPTIRFKQPIHEQVYWAIAPYARRLGMSIVRKPEIRILHHGYEPTVATKRAKSERNLALLENLVEREPENAYALFHYASALREKGDREAALERFQAWEPLAFEQNAAQSHWVLVGFANYAALLNELGRHEEAYALATRAIDRFGETASLRYHRASALHHLGRSEEALAELDAADRVPRDVSTSVESIEFQPLLVPMLRADIYSSLGRRDEAIAKFQQATELSPEDPRPRCGLARIYIAEGNLAAAAEELEQALRSFPNEPQTLAMLAQVETFRLRFDRAIELLQRSLAAEEQGETRRLLGETHLLAGDAASARAVWEESASENTTLVAGGLALLDAAAGNADALNRLNDPAVARAFWSLVAKLLALDAKGDVPGTRVLLDLAGHVAAGGPFQLLRRDLVQFFLKYRFREGLARLRGAPHSS